MKQEDKKPLVHILQKKTVVRESQNHRKKKINV